MEGEIVCADAGYEEYWLIIIRSQSLRVSILSDVAHPTRRRLFG